MGIKNTEIVTIKIMRDPRGSLGAVQSMKDIPFEINRIFYIFDVPEQSVRGGHAHKQNRQLHICLRGSVTYVLDDGQTKEECVLDNPEFGLYMGPMVWHSLKNFSPQAVILVLNSEPYDENEYCRNHADFISMSEERVAM